MSGPTVRIHFLPADREVEVPQGTTVLEAAHAAGLETESLCGGRGICKKCRVRILAFDEPPKPSEREAFSEAELAQGLRLACLWKARRDLVAEIVESEDFAAKAFVAEKDWPRVELRPNVRRFDLDIPEPTVSDQRSDARRLKDLLPCDTVWTVPHAVLKELSEALRHSQWRVSVTTVGPVVCQVESRHLRPPMGLAVDIGTTSIAAVLVNLTTGTAVHVAAHSNPQVRHGADVMSRMDFSVTPRGTEILQQEVVEGINRIVTECCEATGVEARDIYAMTVVGNTTMIHLFLGLCPVQIGVAPFVGVVNEAVTVQAADLGLNVHPRAEVYILPSVAGFVGADTVGAILATRLFASSRTEMVLDIGTNGEIALVYRGELYTASAPAGPAFEGGEIRHGMRATRGAIASVRISDDGGFAVDVIGGDAPRGICGSALIDLCGELYRIGVLDQSGRLRTQEELLAEGASPLALQVAARVREEEDGRLLEIVPASASQTGRPIVLTQNDIRQYQLAKAAVLAGATILLHEVGIGPDEIEAVYLAGTFGSRIDLAHAIRTAMVPPLPLARLHYVGNAALEGARMALVNTELRRLAEEVAARAHHAELSARPDFPDHFVAALNFAPLAVVES